MTLQDVLGQVYAMRESIANGWKPNEDQQALLVLADALEEAQRDTDRLSCLLDRLECDGWGYWLPAWCVLEVPNGPDSMVQPDISNLREFIDMKMGEKHEPF